MDGNTSTKRMGILLANGWEYLYQMAGNTSTKRMGILLANGWEYLHQMDEKANEHSLLLSEQGSNTSYILAMDGFQKYVKHVYFK